MLVAAPVPMRAVFVVKLFGGLVTPYLLLFVLLGPALVGYGQGLGYGPAFFVALLLVLALFPLLPVGLGALLVLAVVRVVPARRARDIVSVLGGLLGVSWYVLSQLSPQIAPRLANVRTLEGLRGLDVPLLPSAWAGRALVAAGEGEWLTLAAYGGLFAALSLAVFAGCLLLAERLYYVGWANMAAQGGKIRRTTNDERRTFQEQGRWSLVVGRWSSLSPPAAAIIFKDLRVFPRDLRNLQQVIFPLALAGIWAFQLLSGGRRDLDDAAGGMGGTVGTAGISFFVCMSLSGALGGPSVSREGRGFWLLKAAPVSARQILLGKLVIAYLPYPTIGALFVAALAALQGSQVLELLSALGLVLLAGLGTSAITLGLGAAFPRFDWENPQQQHTMQAGCLSPLLYLTYIALAAALTLGMPALATALAPQAAGLLTALGWALLVALTALTVWGALSLGAARLERVEV
jgi:ABC-2 type transport system permease protein